MKGISPLIAAVLLIAFTVAIATLIMGWFSTLTRTTTATVTNSTTQAVNCADARVSIRDVYIQTGGAAGAQVANVIVENTGGSSVGLVSLQLINTTGNVFGTGFTAVGAFNESQLLTFTITGATFAACPGSFSKAVLTTNCGGVGDVFTNTPKCG
ncbi:MAG: hypothetical protein HY517_01515 [Candidatus Aenigmarchaeota archaeon]|nr:hypothetical protein [Candidatus Aenigmarchaeota archaeon]